MAGGIQTLVNAGPAPASPGDFASANPRATYTGGPGGLIAGPSGLTYNTFAWVSSLLVDADSGPAVANNFGTGAPTGFVHRDQQGLNTTFLLDASNFIPQGFPVTLFTAGDFWVKNSGSNQVTPGMVAYAALSGGAISFATGSSAATAVTASSYGITAQTFSGFTASITGNVMTVTNVGTGTLYAGATITSPAGVASGTMIIGQLTPLLTGETAGGAGRYAVSIPEQTVASNATFGGTYGQLTLTTMTVAGSTLPIGSLLSGGTVAAGTYITQYVTGTGGAGSTSIVSTNTASSTGTLSGTTTVATKWFAQSSGAAGESIKMSSWALG